jgi:hypothetical protein
MHTVVKRIVKSGKRANRVDTLGRQSFSSSHAHVVTRVSYGKRKSVDGIPFIRIDLKHVAERVGCFLTRSRNRRFELIDPLYG